MSESLIRFSQAWVWTVLSAVLVTAIGIGFRFYPLQAYFALPNPAVQRAASDLIFNRLQGQMMQVLKAQFPTMSASEKQKLAGERARELIRSDRNQFRKAVEDAASNLVKKSRVPTTRSYLLGADSYYFLYLTERILKEGFFGMKLSGGRYYNPLREAPIGSWSVLYLHPHIGALFYRFLSLWNPHLELMSGLQYLPLVLVTFSFLAFFWVCRALKIHLFATLIGGILFALAPVFIQRSALGWYDSDPYNCLFPLLILGFYLWGTKSGKRTFLFATLGGVTTASYAYFWPGWPLFFILILTSGVVSGIFFRRWGGSGLNVHFQYTCIYFVLTFAVGALFLGPARLYEIFEHGFTFMRKFDVGEVDLWPNMFLTVGETRSISVKKLIYLVGNNVTAGLSVVGIIWSLIQVVRTKTVAGCSQWLTLATFFSVLVALGLRTERFALLAVGPAALFAAIGVDRVIRFIEGFARRIHFFERHLNSFRVGLFVVIALVTLPMSGIVAAVITERTAPIMDDAWYGALKETQEKTPIDAIINSWWSPGHFIAAISERRTTIDGANQYQPVSYWVARALLASEEREAAGILRMINLSRNQAAEYLTDKGLELHHAVDIILDVVRRSREEAQQVLKTRFSDDAAKEFLDLTHGPYDVSPTYVLVYDDLVKQNLAMSVLARWDFEKAAEIRAKEQTEKRSLDAPVWDGTHHYVQELLSISGQFLKYRPEAKLAQRRDNLLFFSNGLMVDLTLRDAFIKIPDKNVEGRPVSLFLMADGQLSEITYQKDRVNTSALLIQKDGIFTSVLADRDLLKSMLFRMFYLEGEGLELFKPIVGHEDSKRGTEVYVYQVDLEKF